MTVKDKKDVAGKALYLEFRLGEEYTFQTIATPVTVNLDNSVVPFTLLRRRISTSHPRRNWGTDTSRKTNFTRDAYGQFEKSDSDVAKEKAQSVLSSFYSSQFLNLKNQNWKLFKTPLVVEFNYEELESVRNGKMPVSLYRRVERVRKNQGWGEDLFATPLSV